MTNFENQSGLETLVTNDQHPTVTRVPKNMSVTNDSGLFGKDGFTFFDFIDIINPLQHIPVVSTIYRSITGDQIDPGSRIAGATLFGGPLGGALASMDVALKDKTGLDFIEHTATLFTTGDVANQKAENQGGLPIAAPVRNGIIETNPTQIASLVTQPLESGTKEIPPDKFYSAGMTAIPFAKNRHLSRNQAQQDFRSTENELKFMVEEKKPTNLPLVTNTMFNKTRKPNLNPLGTQQPRALIPRFSASTPLNLGNTKVNEISDTSLKSEALTRENWVIDAMLKGLGKYTSAKKLTKSTDRPTYSVKH